MYYKRDCWKRKDRLMKSIHLNEKCHSWKFLSLISPVGLYPGISPWAFMQSGLICGGIGYNQTTRRMDWQLSADCTLGCTQKPLKLCIRLHEMIPCIQINHKKWYSTYQFVVLPHIFPQITLNPWQTMRTNQLIQLELKDRLKDAPRLKVI